MKFSDIKGHQETVKALKSLVDSGRIPHAILLSGNPGIGKMKLARAFAQYIHCKNKSGGDSCGVCPACLQHKSLNNPDTHYIYPIVKKEGATVSKDLLVSWKEMLVRNPYMALEAWNELIKAGNSQPAILVAESEEILSKASLSSYQEDFKIFIIWLPEKMRTEAANKMLKVIEEPFEDTIFILVSNDSSKILPTILSRTQRFNLSPLSDEAIGQMLSSEFNIPEETALEISSLAEGNISKAIDFATQSSELKEFTSLFTEIMRASYGVRGKKIKELSDETAQFGREKLIRFLDYMARMVRENFIFNLSIESLRRITKEEREFSKNFSPFVNEINVDALLEEISRAANDIERNANAKIVMFDLMFLISKWLHLAKQSMNKSK